MYTSIREHTSRDCFMATWTSLHVWSHSFIANQHKRLATEQLQWEHKSNRSLSWFLVFGKPSSDSLSLVGWLDWLWIWARSLIRATVKTLRCESGVGSHQESETLWVLTTQGRVQISCQVPQIYRVTATHLVDQVPGAQSLGKKLWWLEQGKTLYIIYINMM